MTVMLGCVCTNPRARRGVEWADAGTHIWPTVVVQILYVAMSITFSKIKCRTASFQQV